MRKITPAEMLQLRELLQMEINALAKAKTVHPLVEDEELKTQIASGIQASEARIKGIQQFLTEHQLVEVEVQH
ncbi:MAG TPA: hypothetical protein GXX34_01375 [Clostridia bacterium]|nr:hypothetical protein [Clostridia bacterium]